MRSSIRRTTVVLLVTAFLLPGILAARTPATASPRVEVSRPEGFFSTVWNWLAAFRQLGPAGLAKNGGVLDPSGTSPSGGGTTSTTTTTDGTTGDGSGDNGGALDPSGGHP